jgi:phage terminase large subunit-like protein
VIETSRIAGAPSLTRIVIGIDPPGSARPGADACRIVAVGMAEDGRIYVLEGATVAGLACASTARTMSPPMFTSATIASSLIPLAHLDVCFRG